MAKIGRNEPCPCGSGLKFKRCHGKSTESAGVTLRSDRSLGYPFDPVASMLERAAGPHLLAMRKAALNQWCETLDRWVSNDAQQNDRFDTIRLERLTDIVLGSVQSILKDWDPRFSLQAVRSLPNDVVACVCQLLPQDVRLLWQVLQTMSAVAATAPGVSWPRLVSDGSTAIGLTDIQLIELELRIPDVLGRLIGASLLLVWSQFWYRWAGKGRRIESMPPRFDQSARDAINRWDGQGILVVPAVGLAKDASIENAAAAYDSRREKQKLGISRAGLLQPRTPGLIESPRRLWHAILRAPYKNPLPVDIPKIDKAFPNPNWYPIADTRWQPMIRFLGKYFDPQLKAAFGLSAAELESCLAALGLVVERHTQCCWLKKGRWCGRPALVLQSPATRSDLEGTASHFVSVLQRGTVRSPGIVFRNKLASELGGLGVADSAVLANRFFDAFRGKPNPIGFSRPLLFLEQDEQTCVHDLTAVPALLEGLLATVTAGDGCVANLRSSLFEDQAREYLKDTLSLADASIPWEPNKDIWDGDKNLGDVDFCFSVQDVLINLDMKSWQRSSDYHVGHYHTIKDRCRDLVQQLGKAERRGNALRAKLNAEKANYRACISFLIVATPEYIDPSESFLWYGPPPEWPRVITSDELCELVSNGTQLNELLLEASHRSHAI